MLSLLTLHNDIIKYLSTYLSFNSRVRMKQTCHFLNNLIVIDDLWHIPFIVPLSPKDIVNKQDIRYLRADNSLTTLGHLPNLKALYVCNDNIGDDDIKNLNLEELWLDVSKIQSIGHMTNLKHLICWKDALIESQTLANFSLETLVYQINKPLQSIRHMSNLRILNCKYSLISSDDLKCLNLRKLICSYTNIINIPFMSNLRSLECGSNVSIHPDILPNLQSLDISEGWEIFSDLKYCKNLMKLRFYGDLVAYEDLKYLNPQTLYLNDLENRIDLNHMTNLRKLVISGSNALDDAGVKDLNLHHLSLGESKIYQIGHMTRLEYLNCNQHPWHKYPKSKIDLGKLNLCVLLANNNDRISSIRHMTNLRILDCSFFSNIVEEDIEPLNLQIVISKQNPNVAKRKLSREDKYKWNKLLYQNYMRSYLYKKEMKQCKVNDYS